MGSPAQSTAVGAGWTRAGAHACCFSYQWWRRTPVASWETPAVNHIACRRASPAHRCVDFGWRCVGHRTVQLGWLILDPTIALLVAANIVWTGIRLLRETGYGLLDTALPVAEQQIIASTLR